jgi:hypothetical protein
LVNSELTISFLCLHDDLLFCAHVLSVYQYTQDVK